MSSSTGGLPYTERLWVASTVSAVLIVVGSVTTWFSVPTFEFSASGTDGDGDGIITLVLAVAAGLALLVLPRRRSIAAACGLLSLGVATYDVVRILQLGNPVIDLNVGWGLILVTLASIALVITACLGSPMVVPGRARATAAAAPGLGATGTTAPAPTGRPIAGPPPAGPPMSGPAAPGSELPDVVEPRWDEAE
jgi:hypothetical protein